MIENTIKSLLLFSLILPSVAAKAAEAGDSYPLTRIEWLAVNLSLKALAVKGASSCSVNSEKKVIICSGKTDDGTKDLKSMYQHFFDEEVKKIELAGKVQLRFI